MMRGNLPPQAYTREVVANAYNWLQSQPENIRRMAQNTDTLVALYLRAKRNSDGIQVGHQTVPQTLEQEPAAGVENFRSQLKNLATEIQQFIPEPEKSAPPQMVQAEPTFPPAKMSGNLEINSLDQHSLEILRKVRQHLNLGSDLEALRMLLVLGFEKLQTLFKA